MVKLFRVTARILLFMGMLFVCFDQSRSFYRVSGDSYVTVWKRLGNKCYIIPGKYYWIWKPSTEYIKTTNTAYATIILGNNKGLIVDIESNAKIISMSSCRTLMALYKDNKTTNDSLYAYFDGKYKRYKKGVEYISIDIKENFATNKIGKRLK